MCAKNNKSNKSSPGPDDAPLLLEAPILKDHDNIIHAFTTRRGGYSKSPYDSFNLSTKGGDNKIDVEKNIARLEDFLSIETPLFFLHQVHGKEILVIDDLEEDSGPLPFDAAITSKSEIPIVILTADCLPILLYDPVKSVIAAVHAGWKGTCLKIAAHTVETMKSRFGSNASHIIAAMGPAIGPCCYEVDEPVLKAFKEQDTYSPREIASLFTPVAGKEKRWMFDLVQANKLQLLNVGLIKDNICALKYCTCCRSDLFYSYRRDGQNSGRQGSMIMKKVISAK